MKINPPSGTTFTFGKDKEELYSQAEFLVVYYTTKLKMLKAENPYITAEQAAEETYYKDMISAGVLFLQEKKTTLKPIIKDETTTGPSETLSRDIPSGELSRTDINRGEHLPPPPSTDGRRE